MKHRIIQTTVLAAASAIALCSIAAAQDKQDKVSEYTTNEGTQVTVVSGQPTPRTYGPKPAFEQLDANRDGIITREEAQAYMPLFNDYDNLVHHVAGITPKMYSRWDQH